jgi:hypothetical protein
VTPVSDLTAASDRHVSSTTFRLAGAASVAIAFLFAGVPGILVAGAALVALRRGLGWLAPAGAVVMLVCAAIATVLENSIGTQDVDLNFAIKRPIASAAGGLAAVFTVVAIALAAASERSEVRSSQPAQRSRSTSIVQHARDLAPFLVAATLSTVVCLASSPTALSANDRAIVSNLQAGLGFTTGGRGHITHPTGRLPLGPLLGTLLPIDIRLFRVLAAVAASVLVVSCAIHLLGKVAGFPAAIVSALLPTTWMLDLPTAVAVTVATTAGIVAWRHTRQPTGWHAVSIGLLVGLAVLGCPPAAVTGLIVVASIWWVRFGVSVAALYGTAACTTALLVVLPWLRWLHAYSGSWAPPAPAIWWVVVAVVAVVAVSTPRVSRELSESRRGRHSVSRAS